ncbi:MAG: phage tail tape measure protein [Oscillospiraceae bacterium]|nr:phage tail tape measure protein [Oscillospiraceae bacterium]
MATELAKAYVQIIPSARGISGSISEAVGGEASAAGTNSGNAFAGAFKTAFLAAGIGAALKGSFDFVSDAVGIGMDFDASMSQVAATIGLSADAIANNIDGAADTFDSLREKALEMGSTTNFTATDASEGLNILAMSGYDAASSIEMIDDVLHLAAAGGMDLATSAADISGAMKGFADAEKDSGYYADLMAKGATLANTSVAQLGEAMSGGAANAAAYQQSAESMTLALLRLAEQGDVGSAASTALSAVMKNLYTPTDQAATAMAELGVAAYDSLGNARDLNDVVNDLDSALSGYTAEQAAAYKQTIFGIQGLDAYNKMTVTSIDRQNEWAAALAESSGAASEQYATMTDNLQGDMDTLNSALEGLQIAVSDEVTPTLREFAQFGATALGSITEGLRSDGISGAIDAVSGVITDGLNLISSALPTVLDAGVSLIGALVSGIVGAAPELIGAIESGLVTAIESITIPDNFDGALDLLGNLADAILGGIPDIVSAGGQLVSAFVDALGSTDWSTGLGDIMAGITDAITSMITSLVTSLPDAVGGISDLLSGLIDTTGSLIPMITESAGAIVDTLVSSLTNPDLLVGIGDAASGLISSIMTGITTYLPQLITSGSEILGTLIGGITDLLPTLADVGLTLIDQIIAGLGEAIPAIAESAPALIDTLTSSIGDLLPTLFETATSLVTSLIEGLTDPDTLGGIVDSAASIITSLVTGLIDMIPDLVIGAADLITALAGGLIDNIDVIISSGIELIGALLTGLLEALPGLLERLPEMLMSIADAFLNFDWLDLGVQILNGIIDGILSVAGSLGETLVNIGGQAVDAIAGFFGIHSPSTLMRDAIGRYIPEGIAVGIEANTDPLTQAMDDLATDTVNAYDVSELGDVSLPTSGAQLQSGGNIYNITIQVNGTPDMDVNDLANRVAETVEAIVYRDMLNRSAVYG